MKTTRRQFLAGSGGALAVRLLRLVGVAIPGEAVEPTGSAPTVRVRTSAEALFSDTPARFLPSAAEIRDEGYDVVWRPARAYIPMVERA